MSSGSSNSSNSVSSMDDEVVINRDDSDKNNMDGNSTAALTSTSSSSEQQQDRIAAIQKTIHERLDELLHVIEACAKIGKDVNRLTKDLRQLTKSEDEPLMRRYIGIETNYLVTLARDVTKACSYFKKGVEFVRRCVDLRRNDPKTTAVSSDNYIPVVDEGAHSRFGSIIGHCLEDNTHVTEILIGIESLIGRNDDDRTKQQNVKAVAQYIKKSSVLRRVELSLFEDFPNDMDYVKILLDAIGQNQYITELDCSRCYYTIPSASFCKILSKSRSITSLSVCCAIGWEEITNRMERSIPSRPWGISQSLVHLRIWLIDMDFIHALSFLERGHFQLEKLTLEDIGDGRDLAVLSRFLQTTTTLQHLEIAGFALGTHDVDCIFDGLQKHYALDLATYATKLSFQDCRFENDNAARRFLEHFQSPSTSLFIKALY